MFLRLFAFLCVLAGASLADSDRWYIVEMMGNRSGYVHSSEKATPTNILTRSKAHFEIDHPGGRTHRWVSGPGSARRSGR